MLAANVPSKNRPQRQVPETSDRVPTGQCPLCYTDNSYMNSVCAECGLPLPWAKAAPAEREPSGQCVKCQTFNSYTTLNCTECGARLPWANAVSPTGTGAMNQLVLSGAPAAYNYYSSGPGLAALPAGRTNGMALPPNGMAYGGFAPSMEPGPLVPMDAPSQAIDIVSFLAPPLGFIAHVALLSQMPRVAISAGQKALYGLCLWVPVGLWWLLVAHRAPRINYPTPAPAKIAVPAAASTAWSTTSSSGGASTSGGKVTSVPADDNS